jgi:hypothetical protein
MTITNIKVENVRGIGADSNSLDINCTLRPNIVNFFVASNGFGKTSLSTAFNSLTSKGMKLSKNEYHSDNEKLIPYLSIIEDDNTFEQKPTGEHSITTNFSIAVIKNTVKTKTTGGRYHQSWNAIDPIKIRSITNPSQLKELKSERLELNKLLDSLNTSTVNSGKVTASIIDKKELIVKFPKIRTFSNGERDILNFICQLYSARHTIAKKQKSILIIDEIFDYLDECNLLLAQHYLQKYLTELKDSGKEVYAILLTHLDPSLFSNYRFKTKNVTYLQTPASTYLNEYKLKEMIINRNGSGNNEIKEDISKHFFHYYPQPLENKTTSEYLSSISIDKRIIEPAKFQECAINELEKYKNKNTYDTLLVATGLRIAIEKKVFDLIDSIYHDEYLILHGTDNKLHFAEDKGVIVPDEYFMLGIIYNEAMHLDDNGNKLKVLQLKLENIQIKNLLIESIGVLL